MRAYQDQSNRTYLPNGRAMRIRYLALALGVLTVGACKDATRPDLNNPSVTDFSTITDKSQVQDLAIGLLRGDRGQATNEIVFGETIGRDMYRITGSEPRWVTEMLGSSIDPSDFLGAASWPYANIRLANIGIHGVDSAASTVLTDQEKQATLGFLKTIKALQYLRTIEIHDTAGAPINVDIAPTAAPAPMNCSGDVLAYVAALLDSAATNLTAGGAAFPFTLTGGFAGFDTPGTFLQFNRGLAARTYVELGFRDYAANGSIDDGALTAAQAALTESFMALDASKLDVGPMHVYSTNTGDATNPLFDATIRANPRVVNEADSADQRVKAKIDTGAVISVGGTGIEQVASKYVFTLYPTPTSPVPILMNKELILLQAEVDWGKGNLPGAATLVNFIRTNDGGLPAKALATSAEVLNQLLYEKRYSLLFQTGNRWVDARLFGKLNGNNPPAGLGEERGFAPLNNFPIPADEANARGGDLSISSCTVS